MRIRTRMRRISQTQKGGFPPPSTAFMVNQPNLANLSPLFPAAIDSPSFRARRGGDVPLSLARSAARRRALRRRNGRLGFAGRSRAPGFSVSLTGAGDYPPTRRRRPGPATPNNAANPPGFVKSAARRARDAMRPLLISEGMLRVSRSLSAFSCSRVPWNGGGWGLAFGELRVASRE